jgi:hypothetical protein
LALAYQICHEQLIFPLIEKNNFDCYFITMQNRDKETKGWWDIWKRAMSIASGNYWTDGQGYVQTKYIPVQKCWQNFVYHGPLSLPTITHDQWLQLPRGN